MAARNRKWLIGAALVATAATAGWLLLRPPTLPVAVELGPAVRGRPPVAVVFTSRSEPASLEAAAPPGEGYHHPGLTLWAAKEGRLRLLNPDGTAYELTWGRKLPDGSTLIDVMSPTVSPDGTKILFAGRKASPDPGRFRLYEVGVDGRGLRQITGRADDAGCVEVPPLRFDAAGKVLPPDERKRLDYDDVDPIHRGDGGIVFASSRAPDLGRGHARRSTQLWQLWPGEKVPRPLTANRNNDRWPFLLLNNTVAFSLWSRNLECITADLRDIQPYRPDGQFATHPTNTWMAARVLPDGSQFGYLIKVPTPIWRPRSLFNGRLAFMSPAGNSAEGLRVGQAPQGLLRHAPSSLPAGDTLPAQQIEDLSWGPDRDGDGVAMSVATPSPCPPNLVLVAAAPRSAAGKAPEPGRYGLYLVSDEWKSSNPPPLRPLFDDPALVDAEPVAVYPRPIVGSFNPPPPASGKPVPPVLADGQTYRGPLGQIDNPFLADSIADTGPFQTTDKGDRPLFSPPDVKITHVAFYAAHRDRFDDPERLRVEGKWELLLKAPMEHNNKSGLKAWVPTHTPTVLAGLDRDGKIARWTSPAKDSKGRSATFFAYAGDHYSGTRPNGYHFCLGCHTGHTFIPAELAEQMK